MEAQPIDLGENTPGKGHALRDGIFGALKGIGLAVVVLAVIGGVLNILLLTSTGQELVDHLRPPAVGRYRYVYGGLGSLFATLGPFIALVGSLSAIRRGRTGLAARAGEGMPVRAKLVVAALVLAAGCWGIWLYRVHQLRADDDHDYQGPPFGSAAAPTSASWRSPRTTNAWRSRPSTRERRRTGRK
jgi:hypothetical protein